MISGPPHALVIEGDPSHALVCADVLAEQGFDVRTARDAEEGLALLQQQTASLVVLDLVLPKMSGLLLVDQLKSTPATRDIVLVAMNAMHDPEIERIARQAGCAAYVRKPIDRQSFARTLAAQARDRRES